MQIYPKAYFEKVQDISIEFLKQHHIKALILDVDNTLIDYEKNMPEGIEQWCQNLKKQGITFYILSNSNQKEKVEKVAKILDVPYSYFAAKPLKRGFKKAIQEIGEEKENIAVVGDQIFTDVIGSNRSHLFSILVKPIAEKDILATKIKRPIENLVIKRYIKTTENDRLK